MATQYEIEHNIKAPSASGGPRRRQVDMSTFDAHLRQIVPETSSGSAVSGPPAEQHNNPHAVANPVDLAALYRLVQDQMGTLATTAPTQANSDFLRQLVEILDEDVAHPPSRITGVSQDFVDGLDRVARKTLKDDATCPICAERYLDDPYCLVVELPCHHSHRFDLDCVGPWLRSKGTCPLCRKELDKKEVVPTKDEDEEEEDDMDGLYA
ncbi:hypothetical protein B0T26DRAFT_754945 [Lasiosphaeria miniovina]|uniref:RING-type domain-containing protein n=1 Tax=Lasiosphaeria miniovina TaxID=1954250 RepID=A0AA40DQJ6_9PEZI|nr:uncharacterized protein B0T26DRAFT_754945 [Lasiosphaeria miniovina]KAK0709791.1 hypothetical protein B0T26DRAFT_754945 [Lasiosphaeria miniovina]